MSALDAAAGKPRHLEVAPIDGARVAAARPGAETAKIALPETS